MIFPRNAAINALKSLKLELQKTHHSLKPQNLGNKIAFKLFLMEMVCQSGLKQGPTGRSSQRKCRWVQGKFTYNWKTEVCPRAKGP